VELSPGILRIPAATVCGIIRLAYDANDYEVTGIPDQFSENDPTNWFEIRATLDRTTTATLDEIRPMLRTMLAERFQLRAHRESREMGVYALVVAKGGPKLTPCSDPVVDATGLSGQFDLDLEWPRPSDDTPVAAGIFVAVEEQLGLKLTP
jgi:uncharacterized protein (TIGR03435 family)